MKTIQLQKMNDMNHAIIQFRGFYSSWAKRHHISYQELLVLYSIRDKGCCSQRQIAQNYLLPRQTVHHTISSMREEGTLVVDELLSNGKEKVCVLTEKGHEKYDHILLELSKLEENVISSLGEKEVEEIIKLLKKLDSALIQALKIEK